MTTYKTVPEFLNDLSPDRRAMVECLRETILSSNPNLTEHIKWNSPSYILDEVDRITFNLHDPQKVRLILHCGPAVKEDKKAAPILTIETHLLQWNSNIRATIEFSTTAEIEHSISDLQTILRAWLALNLKNSI